MRRRSVLIVCGGVLAVLVVAAVGWYALTRSTVGPTAIDGAEFYTDPADAVAEYEGRTRQLTLPDGVVWLEGLGPMRDAQGNVLPDDPVIRGGPAHMAELYWYCAWRWEYLTQLDQDPPRAERALETLEQMKQSTFYREGLDADGRNIIDAELTEAGLGDPTTMRNWYEGGCKHLVLADGES